MYYFWAEHWGFSILGYDYSPHILISLSQLIQISLVMVKFYKKEVLIILQI